ncbi:HD domain-containing protein [bacterium]|nr:HD domain-containing protein [bacterium]
MKNHITIEEARALVEKYVQTRTLRLHSRESEVIMRKLAQHLGRDEELWGTSGLLHDLDIDVIGGNIEQHGLESINLLKNEGYDIPEMFQAILSHTEGLIAGRPARETDLDFALSAAENLTGIISAYVLVRPGQKIEGAKVKSVTKKLKDKSFAASVSREFINDIEKIGVERSMLIQAGLEAMTEIADELGM